MKIVHVTEALAGGVLSYIFQLANVQAAAGNDVTVIFSRRTETPADLRLYFSSNVALHELSMKRDVTVRHDINAAIVLWKRLRQLQPDAVHLHSSKAGVLGRFVCWLPGINARVVYSPHGLAFLREDVGALKQRLFRLFEQIAHRFGGTIVASSRTEFDYVVEHISTKDVVLVENGIDFASLPEKSSNPGGSVRVISVNRISPQKDPALFARVAQRLSSPNLTFEWIGGGEPAGRELLERAGVTVFEWLPLADALERLSHADIFLQTSKWEGMPIVLIQAQAIGIPAVVTDVVGNRDVVLNGETGYVCSSEYDLVNCVTKLSSDEVLRNSMGMAARKATRARFSIERMAAELQELYESSIS